MNFPGRAITIFIAIILIVMFPLPYIAEIFEVDIDTIADDETKELSDTIRDNGYLDISMYEDFIEKLDNTGELYDVSIEDISPLTGEDMDSASIEDNSLDTANKSEDSLVVSNSNSIKSKPSNLSINGSLGEVVSNSTDLGDIQSFAAHTLTDDCYSGHRHISSCYSYVGNLGAPVDITLNRQYYPNYNNGVGCTSTSIAVKCVSCRTEIYRLSVFDYDGSNINESYNLYGLRYNNSGYMPDSCWSIRGYSNTPGNPYDYYNSLIVALYNRLLPYCTYKNGTYNYAYSIVIPMNAWGIVPHFDGNIPQVYQGCCRCGSAYLAPVCLQDQDETPDCNTVVTSIAPTNPVQTIKKGEPIITTAYATFLDGHTEIVNCASNFNPNQDGSQTVTLIYTGLVGNAKNYGNITCTMSVTVISKVLTSISVSPTAQVIFRTNAPAFTVTANYSDGSGAVLTPDKYSVSVYNPSTLGKQTLIITYTEGSITKTTPFDLYIDDLMSITVTPATIIVERYTQANALPLIVIANSMYFPSWNVTGSHIISGYSPEKIGPQTVTVSYKYFDTTRTANVQVKVTGLHKTCPICGNTYELSVDDTDTGCPICKDLIVGISVTPDYAEVLQGQSLPITVQATYADGSMRSVSGWTSNYDKDKLGMQNVTVEYGGYMDEVSIWVDEGFIICPVCHSERPVSVIKCPVCSETVLNISIDPGAVTVNRYENIELTVNATFADGSIRQVTDWSIDRTTSEEGVFIATVSYKNATATINLTVLPLLSISCPICGLVYNSGDYPNGCPICSTTLTDIEAYLTSGSRLIQYGSTPNIAIVLIFKDTHREVTMEDYTIENYQPYTLGEQTITVKYGTFSTTLDIEVVNTLTSITCPNGHVYYLNEDGSDPGCPYCEIVEEQENAVYFFDIIYTSEILETLYQDGIYYFKKDHYISLQVTKKQKSLFVRIQQKSVFKTVMLGRKKRYTYGGKVF